MCCKFGWWFVTRARSEKFENDIAGHTLIGWYELQAGGVVVQILMEQMWGPIRIP